VPFDHSYMSSGLQGDADNGPAKLLRNIHLQLPQLEDLLGEAGGHFSNGDRDDSHKRQVMILRICTALQDLLPDRPMGRAFSRIVVECAGQEIDSADDKNRLKQRRVIDAFVQAHFFLELACRKGRELETVPNGVDNDWTALLKLFDLR